MVKLGFEVFDGQACLLYWRRDGLTVVVLLYVDDILMTGNNCGKILQNKNSLCKEFKMKILGSPQKFLRIEIRRDFKNKIFEMSQTEFIDSILKRFGMKNAKPILTPMPIPQAEKKFF